MPKVFSSVHALVALSVAFGYCHCLGGEPLLSPKFKLVPACAALAEVARTNQIPMSQMDASSETNGLRPGDSATFLGTLVLHSNRTQWILFIEAAATDTNKPAEKSGPMVVNLFGVRTSFESKPVPAKLRMLGPFSMLGTAKSIKPQDRKDQFTLNESFLGVGLDQAADIIWRRKTNSTNDTPPQDQLTTTNATSGTNSNTKAKLTPAEKRALAGAIPALTSYFEIVQHTEGLENLLMKLIKTPSLWSLVRHGGVSAGFYFGHEASPANPADWNLPASMPVYYLPCDLRINGQVALKVTLVVTAPHPPLLICGGVIGLLAEKPGDDETYMILRVISARHEIKHENKNIDQPGD